MRSCDSEVFTSSLDKFEFAVSTFFCPSGWKKDSDLFEALMVGRVIRFPVQKRGLRLSQVVLHSVTDLVPCHSVVFRCDTVDVDSARTVHTSTAAFKLMCATA